MNDGLTAQRLSVFRYPGGKTWFVPIFGRWLSTLPNAPIRIVEPFVGGGVVTLNALHKGWVASALIAEIDPRVCAVWRTILTDHVAFKSMIRAFDPTQETVAELLASNPRSTLELAFAALVENRTKYGGIMRDEVRTLKVGYGGKGVRSCWYVDTLCARVDAIHALRDRLTLVEGDGIDVVRASREDDCLFVDPPYSLGKSSPAAKLYRHHALDHDALFNALNVIRTPFLATYNDGDSVRALVERHGFDLSHVGMYTTKQVRKSELIVTAHRPSPL